jgi:hypothetical protein
MHPILTRRIKAWYAFNHQWFYSRLLGPGLFFSSVIFFTQTVGLLGRVISPSQDPYLHTGQHKLRINTHTDERAKTFYALDRSVTVISKHVSFMHSFIHSSMALQPLLGPVLSLSFIIFFTQTVGLFGRVINPSQGHYLHTGQHKHRINATYSFEWDSNPWSQLSSERRQFMS